MGAPTSAVLSEVFLQYLENTVVYDILRESNAIVYFRYVDDVLISYEEDKTNINSILNQFNNIVPVLEFTPELEQKKQLNFLDLQLTRHPNKIRIGIHRKPTTTDVVIPRDSCHPREQKLEAARYFISRVRSYNIDPLDKRKELDTVKQILHNNKYNAPIVIDSLSKEKSQPLNKNGQNSRTSERRLSSLPNCLGKQT
jgi:hypothetical protein